MKRNIIIILILLSVAMIYPVTENEKKLSGSYESVDIDDTAFFNGEYQLFYCITLFEDGRFVEYEKYVNKNNQLDVKYKPGKHGYFHTDNSLLFLEPYDSKIMIFKIENSSIIGTFSERIYERM